ncbi:hypothetical protein ABC977_01415 [Thioalkalicoccus limnaeus]|uniref:Nickel transport protein n=1 Tax=Thioalkalicoccus limnaeus TaxID=120681 RepID=A0ABV4BA51_9GAMM
MLLLALVVAAPGQAHQLKVFAFVDGDRIEGRTYFVGGGAASGALIQIQDPDGRVLAETTPDQEGRFAYQVRAAIDHRIVADTGDGHRAEWTVRAMELAPLAGADPAPAANQHATTGATMSDPTGSCHLDPEELASQIESVLTRQIHPLREQVIALEERILARDILGGLGYILGLVGLAAWWRCRARNRR